LRFSLNKKTCRHKGKNLPKKSKGGKRFVGKGSSGGLGKKKREYDVSTRCCGEDMGNHQDLARKVRGAYREIGKREGGRGKRGETRERQYLNRRKEGPSSPAVNVAAQPRKTCFRKRWIGNNPLSIPGTTPRKRQRIAGKKRTLAWGSEKKRGNGIRGKK